ncbi:hypothetical protein [Pontibacter pudoricolor]|uniref:hypothetical protein n=1 Tax=Pontibacter pudoricolor TaxID=2694930 RepID=UPI0013920F92|nr:hypothetical protein [Pontibacter pudoricolor]
MNTKPTKAFMLAALFTGAITIAGCDTGTGAGETNKEDSDHVEAGSMNEGYTSEPNASDQDTVNLEKKYYDNAKGAVHAGDGKRDSADQRDMDQKQ